MQERIQNDDRAHGDNGGRHLKAFLRRVYVDRSAGSKLAQCSDLRLNLEEEHLQRVVLLIIHEHNCIEVVVVKDENALIGTITAVKTDDEIKAAEIGYCVGRNWWHKGYTSEALGAVIDFLFDEVGLNRIAARHDVNNPNSGGVMKKCGMQFEGIMREGAKNNGGLCDIANYAILKKDRA